MSHQQADATLTEFECERWYADARAPHAKSNGYQHGAEEVSRWHSDQSQHLTSDYRKNEQKQPLPHEGNGVERGTGRQGDSPCALWGRVCPTRIGSILVLIHQVYFLIVINR